MRETEREREKGTFLSGGSNFYFYFSPNMESILTTIIKRMSILLDHKVWKILVDTKRNVYFSWNLEQLDFIVNLERDLDCMMNSMGFTDDLDFLMSTIN